MKDDFDALLRQTGLTPPEAERAELRLAYTRLTEMFKYLDTTNRPPHAQALAIFDPTRKI